MKRLSLLLFLLALAAFLAACAQDDPTAKIEAYLTARVNSDSDAVRALSCAAYEAESLTQAESFASMNAELQDMACAQSGEEGDDLLIACEGKIVTTYADGEVHEWPLGVYRMVQENNEWLMCGEVDAE